MSTLKFYFNSSVLDTLRGLPESVGNRIRTGLHEIEADPLRQLKKLMIGESLYIARLAKEYRGLVRFQEPDSLYFHAIVHRRNLPDNLVHLFEELTEQNRLSSLLPEVAALERLREAVQLGEKNEAQAVQEACKESPFITQELTRLIKPTNSMEFYTMIIALVMLITFFAQQTPKNNQTQFISIDKVEMNIANSQQQNLFYSQQIKLPEPNDDKPSSKKPKPKLKKGPKIKRKH